MLLRGPGWFPGLEWLFCARARINSTAEGHVAGYLVPCTTLSVAQGTQGGPGVTFSSPRTSGSGSLRVKHSVLRQWTPVISPRSTCGPPHMALSDTRCPHLYPWSIPVLCMALKCWVHDSVPDRHHTIPVLAVL